MSHMAMHHARYQEWLAGRLEDERAIAQLRKEQAVTHRTTPFGLAKRPPDISSSDKALDDLYESIAEGIELARTVEEREVALEAAGSPDASRFPVLRDQS